MSEVVIEHQKNVAILRLKNGVTNAISRIRCPNLSETSEKNARAWCLPEAQSFFPLA